MLYDPKWEKPSPSVAGFKAWLEQQNPNEMFTYADCRTCAVAQYLHSIGSSWDKAERSMVGILNMFACHAHLDRQECFEALTFGAVLCEMGRVS